MGGCGGCVQVSEAKTQLPPVFTVTHSTGPAVRATDRSIYITFMQMPESEHQTHADTHTTYTSTQLPCLLSSSLIERTQATETVMKQVFVCYSGF